ncbi:MAG: acetylxylan esterase [Lentisphaeria bacterium]|nr:acetylxylan esterase [Lentisphaeria bacterium]
MKNTASSALRPSAADRSCGDLEIRVESSSRTGFVGTGEKVQVRAAVFNGRRPVPPGYTLHVTLGKDGNAPRTETVPAEKGFAAELSLEEPGWAYVTFQLRDPRKGDAALLLRGERTTAGTGIVLEPHKLRPVRPEPPDFDAFWRANRAELAETPLTVLEKKPVPPPADAGEPVACFDMKLACAGPRPVSGYLCVPQTGSGRYPAILCLDGAGVHDSGKLAFPGAVTLTINAHGIANGQPEAYYRDLEQGALKDYPLSGADDRNTICFRYMFLRVLRALEYLKTLPEWNGRDLVVRGSSQGGAQALFGAAMDRDVTLAVTFVPAMCDFAGCFASPRRTGGWPRPYGPDGKDPARRSAWDHYDLVNFARRITCRTFVSAGLADTTCPPTSVFCMFGALAAKEKHIEIHRDMGHFARNDAGSTALEELCRSAAQTGTESRCPQRQKPSASGR